MLPAGLVTATIVPAQPGPANARAVLADVVAFDRGEAHGAVDELPDRVVVGDAHAAGEIDVVGALVAGRAARRGHRRPVGTSTHLGPIRVVLRTGPTLLLGVRDARGTVLVSGRSPWFRGRGSV